VSIAPESASGWREIADQLTSEQIDELEDQKRDPEYLTRLSSEPVGRHELQGVLLARARRFAGENVIAGFVGPVQLPVGAVSADVSQDVQSAPYRIVCGAGRHVDSLSGFEDNNVVVSIAAIQFVDGSVDDGSRGIEAPTVHILDNNVQTITGITASHARELAAALVAAADEIDGWATSAGEGAST
jgi:hypothetical protein